MIAERNVPELAKAEVLQRFQKGGDPTGELYRQLLVIDLCWQALAIEIDNMDE